MPTPHIQPPKTRFTHYAYYPTHEGKREPTGLLELSTKEYWEKKILLDGLRRNGEYLAKLPEPVENMGQLRELLRTK